MKEVRLPVRVFLTAVLFLYPLSYFGMFAGDAEIHLVYGANASEGALFEFNRGETSPGVTSPGYMLLVAALFRLFPASAVPLVMKGLGLLTWYGLVLTVYLLARRFGLRDRWAWVACCVVGLLPGSAYNATLGMENGIFAFAVAGWLYAAMATGWYDTGADGLAARTWWLEGCLGAALGLAVWLRPEGALVGGLALTHRLVYFVRAGVPLPHVARRTAGFFMPFALATALLVAFHYAYTGYLLPASGRARMLMGSLDAFWLGPLAVNTNVMIRLLAYFPLTLGWLIGLRLVIKRIALPAPARAAAEFAALLAGTCFVLYSTVLGSGHLARYLIFVMPLAALVGTLGARWLWERGNKNTVMVLGAALAVVFALETRARLRMGGGDELVHAMNAPADRAGFSDELYAALGSPSDRPIVVAWAEVHWRYWLDDRFVVRSLDGRTDPLMLEFSTPRFFDHVAYIKARGIRFLMELPNYNRDADAWSLQELEELGPSQRLEHEGLVFSRPKGNPDIIQVEPVR